MKCKTVSEFYLVFVIAGCFLARCGHATPATKTRASVPENLRLLCEEACSKPGWKTEFDEEKSTCFCTVGDNVNETEQDQLKNQMNKSGLTLIFIKSKTSLKRGTNTPAIKDRSNSDNSKTTSSKRRIEDNTKAKWKKKFDEKISTKATSAEPVNTKLNHEEVIGGNNAKDASNIEVIPKKIKEDNIDTANAKTEDVAIKRIPKQLDEIESMETVAGNGSKMKHIKPLKMYKKVKTSDPLVGDAKSPKPLITTRKFNNHGCGTPVTKNQLENARDRIDKLIGRLAQPTLTCTQMNTDIETIKTILQQASYKGPEIRHREIDRTKILGQIREREKERQARIQSRLGHLDFGKHKPGLLGGFRSTEKPTSVEEKVLPSGKLIVEPKYLLE